MPSIDERIVSMAFENAKFEAGVAQTMRSLSKLDSALQSIGSKNSLADIEKAANKVTLEQPMSALDKLRARFSRAGDGAAEGFNQIERAGSRVHLTEPIQALDKVQAKTAQVGVNAADGFNEIERAAGRTNLQGLTASLDSVTAKFSVLQAAASVALGNIASQASSKGASFAKSFSMGPIMQGFDEYQTNLKSIQTIMSNTEGQRISGLDQTNKHLDELNTYSDQTIYNFSQMAKNIGTFTAAGVDLKTSTASIKGIANLAALSGSSSQQASVAMYQLSQAIASGKVGLQDWNSVVNAGMGGRKFQNSLIQTGVAMGTIEEGAVKIDKATGKATINGQSFRESIMAKPGQQSWLTSEVLTGSLEQFTGDMTDAQLKAKGFTDEQIKSIQATAKTAKKAATEVKTLPQVFDVAREAIGSGWAKTFQHIFGDFNQAKKLFTGMSNTINEFIGENAAARNKVLKEWNKEGGRAMLIEGIKNAFKALFAILKPVGQAFRDVFPRKTADDLLTMTKRFRDFTAGLKPSAATVDGLRRTFRGLFAVLHIGWEIVKGVVGVIGDLIGVVTSGSGGFLNFTGSIGDLLVALDNALTKGGLLKSFFAGISSVLQVPLKLLTGIAGAIFNLFGGVDAGGGDKVAGSMDKVKGAADPLASALDTLKQAWDGFQNLLSDAKDFVSPWLDKIANALGSIGDAIGNALEGGNFDHVMTTLQTGFIGGIFLALKKGLGGFGGKLGGVLDGVNDTLGALTGNLKAMQQHVKAQTILMIATAIGVLAASIFTLSKVDPAELTTAMTAISVGMGQLVGAMAILGKVVKGPAMIGMPLVSASLILLAGSMVVLGGAMKIFATMSWEELGKGMAALAGGLAAMAVASKAIGPMGLVAGPAVIALAFGMNILALAVKQFASMSWEEIARGLVGVLGALAALVIPIAALGPSVGLLLVAAPGLIGIAFALNMLAGAVLAFGSMDIETMAKGIGGAAVALLALGIAINAVPPHAALMAGGLVILAVALNGIASAVKLFGSMSIGEIAKGLIAMGGALAILAVGLTAMSGTLAGAAGLMAAALALAVLAPTMAFLGTLEWGTIFKGLAAIALALGTLAIAGTLAAPGLSALGVALLPLAGVFVLTAGATYLFATALQKLAGDGMKGVGVLVAAITAFVAVLPKILIDFLKGLVQVVAEIAKIAPQVAASMVKIINTMLDVVIQSTPKLAMAIGTLVAGMLQVIIRDSPKLIQAGVTLMVNLLKGLDSYIPQMIPRVASIIAKFLTGLAAQAPKLTAAGARFLIAFLSGIGQHVSKVVQAGYKVVFGIIDGVVRGIPKMVALGARAITGFLNGVANAIPRMVRAGVRIVTSFLDGVSSQFDDVARAATRFVTRFFNAFGSRENTRKMVNAGLKAAINILRGIADGIRQDDNMSEIVDAAVDVGVAIVDGIVQGLKDLPEKLAKKLFGPVKDSFNSVKDFIKPGSPSKLFTNLASTIPTGFEAGLRGLPKKLDGGIIGPLTALVKKVKKNLKSRSPSQVFVEIGQAVTNGLGIGLQGVPGALDKGVTGPIAAMLKQTKGLREFGKFLGSEFRQGLTGGLWDDGKSEAQRSIEGAFTALKSKLTEQHKALSEQIKQQKADLKDLEGDTGRDNYRRDGSDLNGRRREIAEAERMLALSQFRSRSLMAQMEDEKAVLVTLAAEYEKTGAQLQKAKELFDQYKQQYSQLPEIGGIVDEALAKMKEADDLAAMSGSERWKAERERQKEEARKRNVDQVALYKQSLQEQIAATQKYMETLKKLREAGLDDATYQKLLAEGTKGQDFASQLLAKGKGGIEELNKLNAELAKQATSIANNAAEQLYKAGTEAATGFIKGLQDKQAEIRKMMEFIADSMIKSLKFRLGIRSPSRVFAELGLQSVQGMADGLKEGTTLVSNAAANVGDEAAAALSRSLAGIQNGVDTDLTITPVLDLTQVERDASKLQDLTDVAPITAEASYGQATAISEETRVAAEEAAASAQPSIEVKLEQTNTSPKALDEIEIYRNTRNQLSQVKSALGLVTKTN
jgi:tape measure domain-containing protein